MEQGPVKTLSTVWLILAVVALTALAFAAHTTPYFGIDLAIAHSAQSVQAQWFAALMQVVDWPGFPPQVYGEIALLFLFLYLTHRRWEAVCLAYSSFFVGAVGLLIKVLVNRPRPSPGLIHVLNPALDGGKFSFTAGHVESYIAILGFLWILAYSSRRRSAWRVLTLVALAAMMLLIGLARIYSGEHWFSDVVGGYLFGSIALIQTMYVYEWGKTRFFPDERRDSRSANSKLLMASPRSGARPFLRGSRTRGERS
jgi:membrane-associated phospholipid phosphatase